MKTLTATLLILTTAALGISQTHAQAIYTSGHADIGLAFEDGALVPHWHLDAGNIVDGSPIPEEAEYAPEDLVAGFANTRPAAAGSSAYLGVDAGTPIYMGGPSVAWQPYLGLGTEELDPADWLGPITVTLTGWTISSGGEFALYTTNGSGTTTSDIFLSTFNPASADIDGIGQNSFLLDVGGHGHYTFGFTAPGDYQITLSFSGTHVTEGAVSASGHFGFQVVPEPSTYALIVMGAFGLLLMFRKRRLSC